MSLPPPACTCPTLARVCVAGCVTVGGVSFQMETQRKVGIAYDLCLTITA